MFGCSFILYNFYLWRCEVLHSTVIKLELINRTVTLPILVLFLYMSLFGLQFLACAGFFTRFSDQVNWKCSQFRTRVSGFPLCPGRSFCSVNRNKASIDFLKVISVHLIEGLL